MSVRMVSAPGPAPRIRDRVTACGGLLAALLLLRFTPLRFTLAAARLAKRGARRSTSHTRADEIVAACRAVSHWYPGRTACLEISLAVLLAATLHRRSVDWCIGCRVRPFAAHAWIETRLQPVGEEWSGQTFHPTVRI
ncbi:lasso peptide biosynthesis B2 protein [Haloactinospora alba]|uniref:lasso peptide biosynthesis B2 protein n=1 Tax=Haloactinospora alba TaxID=405555 RepID=UPI001FE9BAE4|nr:lasso peptide biosynthesis B2 protein [Haloactinospora alba]